MNKSDIKKIINTIDIIEARLRYNIITYIHYLCYHNY